MKQYNTIVGIDLDDKKSHYALMFREEDTIQEEGVFSTTPETIRRRFSTMEPALIAMEAGTHSRWVSALLAELGHKTIVANPRKLRAIYTNERKQDPVDARMLARLARVDPNLLSPIQHRGATAQKDLAILHARDALVTARTALVNHVRGVVKSFGVKLPDCDTDTFHKKVIEKIPEDLMPALLPLIQHIHAMTQQIHAYDKTIRDLCENHYPEAQLLQTVQGVGPITSLAYVLTLEDPIRFRCARSVGVYLGLTPGKDQSGNHDPQLPITKAGNVFLRSLLVGAAQFILGPLNRQDSELRQWGLRLAGPLNTKGKHDKNRKKRAVVAVARKLAVLLHTLWSTGQVYDPFFQQTQIAAKKGKAA
jgi:transposase